MMAMGLVGRRLRRLLHPASATETEVSTRKWMVNGLRVANTFVGFSGFLILLYSLLLIGINIRDRHLSWFPFACLIAGGTLSFTACIGHVAVSHARTRFGLSCYILLLFMVLIVETLISLDVMLNDDWDEDFPKDKSDMFDDFVDVVDSNSRVFRVMWTLLLLAQVTCFVLAIILKSPRSSGHVFRASPVNEPLIGANPPFVSNKYAEY